MRNLYYDDYTDEDLDDIQDVELEDTDLDLDDPYDLDDIEDDDVEIKTYVKPKTLLAALRDELKVSEADRGSLTFTYNGVDYDGIPMVEINPNKFVFKLESSGKLQSFLLSDIYVTA